MTDFPWYPQIDGCRECGATEADHCTCSEPPTCESCWLEWATIKPPKESGLTWVCAKCMEAFWPYHGLAEVVNRAAGKSGVL